MWQTVKFPYILREVKKSIPNGLTNPENFEVVLATTNLLLRNGIRSTEEFSMLVFGNLLACVTEEELKKDKKELNFRITICVRRCKR